MILVYFFRSSTNYCTKISVISRRNMCSKHDSHINAKANLFRYLHMHLVLVPTQQKVDYAFAVRSVLQYMSIYAKASTGLCTDLFCCGSACSILYLHTCYRWQTAVIFSIISGLYSSTSIYTQ